MKNHPILALFLFPSFSALGFVPATTTRRTQPAFISTRLAVVTGPEGKPASSAKEDLELTFQIISNFIQENDDNVLLHQDANQDVVLPVDQSVAAAAADPVVASIAEAKQKALKEIEATMTSYSIHKAMPKKVNSKHGSGYTKRAPHVNAHLFSLSDEDGGGDGQQRTNVALHDDFSSKATDLVLEEEETEEDVTITGEDVLKAASDFFSSGDDVDAPDDFTPSLLLTKDKFLEEVDKEESKHIVIEEEDITEAAEDFFSGDFAEEDDTFSFFTEENILEEKKDITGESILKTSDSLPEDTDELQQEKVEKKDIMDLAVEEDVWEDAETSDGSTLPITDVQTLEEKSDITEEDVIQARTDFFSDDVEASSDSVESLKNEQTLNEEKDDIKEENAMTKSTPNIAWDGFNVLGEKSFELEHGRTTPEEEKPTTNKSVKKEKASPKAFDSFEDFGSQDGQGFTWL